MKRFLLSTIWFVFLCVEMVTASVDTIWTCNNNFAHLHPIVSGGTTPYFYYWSDGETNLNRDSLPVGIYELLVIDAHYCSIIKKYVIKKSIDNINISYGDVSCPQSNDGWIYLNVPMNKYPYTWYINGNLESPLEDLKSGVYNICLIDGHNCKTEKTIIINEPKQFIFDSVKIIEPECPQNKNGSIEVWSVRANSYIWNTFNKSNSLINLDADIYTVDVIYM